MKRELKVANIILNSMSDISYGFPENGHNIAETDPDRFDNDFCDFYYMQTPEELISSRVGVCWEQVELERYLFERYNFYNTKSYFILCENGEDEPSHTFLTFECGNYFYWIEHSWGTFSGIHEYIGKEDLIADVIDKFVEDGEYYGLRVIVYEYDAPTKTHMNCDQMYEYVKTQPIVFDEVV